MILVPLLNPKFATVPAEKSCELRVRGTRARSLQIEAILLCVISFLRMIFSEKSVNFSGSCAHGGEPRYSTSSTSVGSAPNAFWARAACMNSSRSPSSTAPVFEVETPVRKSLTIW
jgi:hypothetical protein